MANIKLAALDINMTVKEETLETDLKLVEDGINEVLEVNEQKALEKIAELDTSITELKAEKDDAITDTNKVKEELKVSQEKVGGIEKDLGDKKIEDIKSLMEDAKAYREKLIDDYIKFATLSGKLENDKDKVKAKKDELEDKENDIIKYFAKEFELLCPKIKSNGQLPEPEDKKENKLNTVRDENYSL